MVVTFRLPKEATVNLEILKIRPKGPKLIDLFFDSSGTGYKTLQYFCSMMSGRI